MSFVLEQGNIKTCREEGLEMRNTAIEVF